MIPSHTWSVLARDLVSEDNYVIKGTAPQRLYVWQRFASIDPSHQPADYATEDATL
jgi:hypothetical protein